MDYRIAPIKPHKIDETGQVTFTDGRKTGLMPNQSVCEMYGYTYEPKSGVCRLNQQFETGLDRAFNQETNKVMGTHNFINPGVRNSLVNGFDNRIESNCKSPLVTGTGNSVKINVDNAVVLGENGRALRQSEFVVGGGAENQAYSCSGESSYSGTLSTNKQFSIINLSGVTCDNSNVDLTVNGDGSSYIEVDKNSIIAYEINVIRMELAGSSAAAGKYTYFRGMSAVHIDNSYNMTFSTLTMRNQANEGGNNGSVSMVDTSTSDLKSISLRVSDRANVVNQWSATIRIYEVVSTVTTF